MNTRKVEREVWENYFDALSNVLQGHPRIVTVELVSETLGDEVLAEHARLTAIIWEPKGSEAGDIDIEIGNGVTGDRLVHRVDCADVVWVEEDDSGVPMAIDIEGRDVARQETVKAIIRFED